MSGGHIWWRSPGSAELRWRQNGRTCTETVRTTSKKVAQARLRELMTAADKGTAIAPSKVTLAAFLDQRIAIWNVGARTRENYENLAKLVSAHLGSIQLQQLRTLDVERWHAELRAAGLAPSTIRSAHRLLVRALADGVHHRLLAINPAREQPAPRAPGRKIAVPTEDQIAPMLERLRGDPFYVPVVVALYCGLRRGEQLALKWSDLDLDAGTLRVERALDETAAGGVTFKDPKTESGHRVISLPGAAVEALRAHRVRQLELALALGLGRPPDDALVFPARMAARSRRTPSAWLGSGPCAGLACRGSPGTACGT